MTTVIIPWRSGCPHRARALDWVTDRYRTLFPDWTLAVGEPTTAEWCKASAVTTAAHAAADGPIVVADADVFPADPQALTDAVAALSSHPWAIPHSHVHRYTEAATAALLAGTDLPAKPFAERPYLGFAGGGITVLDRSTYLDVPLDPRFVGWGQEDSSWALALRTLTGVPWRGSSPLLHLYHPPQPRITRAVGSDENRQLFRRYHAARHRSDRMRELIQEAA